MDGREEAVEIKTYWQGYDFSAMTDAFLLESFDTLSVATSRNDDFLPEWHGCKEELAKRLHDLRTLQVEKELAL